MGPVQINWQDAAGLVLPPEIKRAANEACGRADGGRLNGAIGWNDDKNSPG